MRARSLAIGRRFAKVLLSAVGYDELLVTLGLALIAIGFRHVWEPGAYLVPGAVLLWIALPARAAFIARPPRERGHKD